MSSELEQPPPPINLLKNIIEEDTEGGVEASPSTTVLADCNTTNKGKEKVEVSKRKKKSKKVKQVDKIMAELNVNHEELEGNIKGQHVGKQSCNFNAGKENICSIDEVPEINSSDDKDETWKNEKCTFCCEAFKSEDVLKGDYNKCIYCGSTEHLKCRGFTAELINAQRTLLSTDYYQGLGCKKCESCIEKARDSYE